MMPAEIFPTELLLQDDGSLRITWSDSRVDAIPFRVLRDACPCAQCQAARLSPPPATKGALPVLTAAQARPLVIQRMHPVGQYAYAIEFSDGHSSGIFPFELLRQLREDIGKSPG
jgi:DUF971 family protein